MVEFKRKTRSKSTLPAVERSIAQFLKRLHSLDGILAKIKNPPVRSERYRPVPVAVLETSAVKLLLLVHFMSGMFIRSARSGLLCDAQFERQVPLLRAVLRSDLLPEHRTALGKILRDVSALAVLQRRRKQRTTCPSVSAMITDLTTWLLRCRELSEFRPATLYEFVGLIVEKLSTPTCLLCKKRHQFKTWQAVRMRDRYRDAAQRPGELLATAIFLETIQIMGPARTRADVLAQQEAARLIVSELLLKAETSAPCSDGE